MATEAQIIANRRNAQKSDSPPNKPPISPNLPTIYNLFMQNKANFRKSQMNINLYNTMDYENKSNWTFGENEPKTNPIKANVGSLGNLFDHIEIFVFKTKLKNIDFVRQARYSTYK